MYFSLIFFQNFWYINLFPLNVNLPICLSETYLIKIKFIVFYFSSQNLLKYYTYTNKFKYNFTGNKYYCLRSQEIYNSLLNYSKNICQNFNVIIERC